MSSMNNYQDDKVHFLYFPHFCSLPLYPVSSSNPDSNSSYANSSFLSTKSKRNFSSPPNILFFISLPKSHTCSFAFSTNIYWVLVYVSHHTRCLIQHLTRKVCLYPRRIAFDVGDIQKVNKITSKAVMLWRNKWDKRENNGEKATLTWAGISLWNPNYAKDQSWKMRAANSELSINFNEKLSQNHLRALILYS
jgi:hypothetical protein